MKRTLRIALLLSFACAVLAASSNFAQAQKVDLAFGLSTINAPSASSETGNHVPASLNGGSYPGISGDVLFFHNLGIGADIFWKGSRADYQGDINTPIRPIFFDFNAVYSPKIVTRTYLELVGGIGALDTRVYAQGCGNGVTTNFCSDKHFMADLGGGIKFYPKGGIFIRPEARVYLVNNNLHFSSARATRYGLSIGYTFGHH